MLLEMWVRQLLGDQALMFPIVKDRLILLGLANWDLGVGWASGLDSFCSISTLEQAYTSPFGSSL